MRIPCPAGAARAAGPSALLLGLLAGLLPAPGRADFLYERDIAPILRTYCAGCHNDADREGDFSVETFAALRQGGDRGDPLRPGRADDSLLVRLLEGRARPPMPPPDEPPVPPAELARLKAWIAAGAPGPRQDASILARLVAPQVPVTGRQRLPVTALTYAADGRRVAVAMPGRVELRRELTGPADHVFTNLPGKVNAVRFSPDGRQLVAATGIPGLNGVARLWAAADAAPVRDFAGHRDTLFAAEFSPDGGTLATAGYDRIIRLWRVADGELRHTLDVHNGAVFALAFSLDGAVLASASADQTVKLWRAADGARLDTLNQPQAEVHAVAFTPDGRHILAAGADRRIHLWRFIATNAPALNPHLVSRFAHEAAITALAVAPDGRSLATAAADRSLKLWSLPDLEERHAFPLQPDQVAALAWPEHTAGFAVARLDGSLDFIALPAMKESAPVAPAPALAAANPPAPAPAGKPNAFTEQEPNDTPPQAQPLALPALVSGAIQRPGDVDLYRFAARAGEPLALAIHATSDGSALDSRIEILAPDGRPVEQVVLQAVRASWFTFRGKDSDTSDDFRLHDWERMELDEYFYANGEVVRLWLYPRGPDSGFKVYPGEGRRHTAFFTTPIAHALNEPGYVVRPWPAGSQPPPNGLPVFRLNWENDDDPAREAGVDSRLVFTPPADGDYLVRVSDTRGFGGATNFTYRLEARSARPDFHVTVEGLNPKVSPGSGRELRFVAVRREGFDGPIRIDVANLPPGFTASTPVEIEAGQRIALTTLHAAADAADPDEAADAAVVVTATARLPGGEVTRSLGTLGNLQLGAPPKLTVEILPDAPAAEIPRRPDGTPAEVEFTLRPGETITARVRAVRHDFQDRIEFGNEDSGRNLPHGLYVDNIGLNGLLIVEGQTEREFFITAAPVARPGIRRFHLRARGDDGQVSRPAVIRVLSPAEDFAATPAP